MSPILKRSEIPFEETWSTETIYPDPATWEEALKVVTASLPEVERFKGRLGDSPQALLDWIHTAEQLNNSVERLRLYAFLNYSADSTNEAWKARVDQVSSLQAMSAAATAFAEPELLELGFQTLRRFVEEIPDLKIYTHYFERLERRAPHIRSAEVEQVLGQVSDPFRSASATHGILVNADLTFQPAVDSQGEQHEVAHASIARVLSSPDRTLRRSAWENYADAHLAFKHTQANALATGIRQDVFNARVRGYPSSLEASLEPNFIPLEVFHNILGTFRKHLPTWHRYWDLRRRWLGIDRMHVYDTRAALTAKMPEVSFAQAVETVCAGMAPLGDEYVSVLRKGALEERWVDYHPNQGKRFGAFSSGVKGTHPFVMMTFNNDIFGVSTLAHELGHSMHSFYSRGAQPQTYSYYGLFLAEVASNFNQAMVRAHLLDTLTDRDSQIAVIEEAMGNFHRYFFIMPTLARFELEIHERVERGEGLSARTMIDLLADLFSEGYGPEVEMDRNRVGSVWMQFSTHLYSNFYVYQYATGISGAHALVDRVLHGGPQARDNYLAFLKAGSSIYPLDALQLAGVDLSSPEPVEKAFAMMASYVDRLENL